VSSKHQHRKNLIEVNGERSALARAVPNSYFWSFPLADGHRFAESPPSCAVRYHFSFAIVEVPPGCQSPLESSRRQHGIRF